MCLLEEQRLQEAELTLRQLYTMNPKSQDAVMGLGLFAIIDGRVDQARQYFQQV